jgi:hypothetical protein
MKCRTTGKMKNVNYYSSGGGDHVSVEMLPAKGSWSIPSMTDKLRIIVE